MCIRDRLGRPKKDELPDLKQNYIDECERVEVERRLSPVSYTHLKSKKETNSNETITRKRRQRETVRDKFKLIRAQRECPVSYTHLSCPI